MARGLAVLVAVGAVSISSVVPASAAVYRPSEVREVAHSDRRSAAEARALDELLERSGLRVQLDSLSAGVRAQFLRGQSALNTRDRVVIDRIVSERFDSEALHARIRLEFDRDLEAANLEKALAWYDSPLGRRITGLELASLVSPPGREAVADLEKRRPSARRVDLLERLDASGGASETTVDVTLAIVRSLTRAYQPGLPAVARLDRGQLDAQFAEARSRTLERMKQASLVAMLLAYRELSDPELDQYVQFVESEAGRWFMSVMNSALMSAVDVAAEKTATELAITVPQLVRDLR